MPLLDNGAIAIASLLIGDGSVTAYNNANAHTAVGNSTTAFNKAHTDLQGASKFRKAMDATYPQRTNGVLTFRSTFGSTDANFAWEEWGIANHASAGTLLNRIVEAKGTKASGSTWIFTTTVTVAA